MVLDTLGLSVITGVLIHYFNEFFAPSSLFPIAAGNTSQPLFFCSDLLQEQPNSLELKGLDAPLVFPVIVLYILMQCL